ncbi:MAG: helix-turn-helix domain-containing protein [Rhizobiales bacterium]|nr:helix-turn-helix domain-containing protein [Hyphomicrobiales bacterium]
MGTRSLDRGIYLLEILSQNISCSLADLHKSTGLAKPTICRMMDTLISRGWVRRSIIDKHYRLNITVSNFEKKSLSGDGAIIFDIVMPHLIKLTTQIYWPASFHILNGIQLKIADGTDKLSPFGMHNTIIDLDVNMFNSATGMACLMCMDNHEIEKIHEQTKDNAYLGLKILHLTFDQFIDKIEQARQYGYGYRLKKHQTIKSIDDRLENRHSNNVDDGLSAIAVAIKTENKIYGAINLYWPKTYKTHIQFADDFLINLQHTAKDISDSLAEVTGI